MRIFVSKLDKEPSLFYREETFSSSLNSGKSENRVTTIRGELALSKSEVSTSSRGQVDQSEIYYKYSPVPDDEGVFVAVEDYLPNGRGIYSRYVYIYQSGSGDWWVISNNMSSAFTELPLEKLKEIIEFLLQQGLKEGMVELSTTNKTAKEMEFIVCPECLSVETEEKVKKEQTWKELWWQHDVRTLGEAVDFSDSGCSEIRHECGFSYDLDIPPGGNPTQAVFGVKVKVDGDKVHVVEAGSYWESHKKQLEQVLSHELGKQVSFELDSNKRLEKGFLEP